MEVEFIRFPHISLGRVSPSVIINSQRLDWLNCLIRAAY